MNQFNDPVSLVKGVVGGVKNLFSPPKPQIIDRTRVTTPKQDLAAEQKAADEARRKQLAEAAQRKGASQARSVLGGTAVLGEGDVKKTSLIG